MVMTISDFRNRIVDIDFECRFKKNNEEIELLQTFRELYQIPNSAYIELDYVIDEYLCLLSNIKLNISSKKGFRLMKIKKQSELDFTSYFGVVEPEIKYKYFFKM